MSAEMHLQSPAETAAFAAHLVSHLHGGHALLLAGELGSGKTTFTQALAQALGVRERVTSPTFTIVSHYPTPHRTIKELVHVDLFRLTTLQARHDLAVQETVEAIPTLDRLTVIEWADKLGQRTIPASFWLQFKHGAHPSERLISVDPSLGVR